MKVVKKTPKFSSKTKITPHRPISGGTLEGQRPARFHYWRVGSGDPGSFGLEFWVARAGEYHGKPGYFYRANPWEQENWTQFYYFIEGEAVFYVNAAKIQARPGDFLILPAGISIESQSEREIQFHWFAMEGRWPGVLGERPVSRRFTIGTDETVQEYFSAIRETLILQRPGYMLRALGIFYTLIARIEELTHRFSSLPGGKRHTYPEAVRNAIIYLEEHYTENFDAAETAAIARVSKSHLRALFEKWLGESPKKFHTRCRVQEAKRLLREENLSVSEVAVQVGFTDRSHFSRVFRQFAGVAPSQYKDTAHIA